MDAPPVRVNPDLEFVIPDIVSLHVLDTTRAPGTVKRFLAGKMLWNKFGFFSTNSACQLPSGGV
jgi:hypothetical protein